MKEEGVWQCGCGGQTWLLLENGRCVCVECDMITTRLRVISVRDERLHEAEAAASGFGQSHLEK